MLKAPRAAWLTCGSISDVRPLSPWKVLPAALVWKEDRRGRGTLTPGLPQDRVAELVLLRNRYVLFLCSRKGARWGEPQAQRHGLLTRPPSPGVGVGGEHALPGTVTAARASGGGGAEPGGVWGPGEASSHRRVRTSCRDLPWEARGPWGSFMERSHALWLSTREPPEWGRGGSRSVEPVPASLERDAAPGPASALLPRWLWQG